MLDNEKFLQLQIIIEKNAEHQLKTYGNIMPYTQTYQKPQDNLTNQQRYYRNHPEFMKFLNKKYYNSDYHKAYYRNKVKIHCNHCGHTHSKYHKCSFVA